jgi:hypothetical protein
MICRVGVATQFAYLMGKVIVFNALGQQVIGLPEGVHLLLSIPAWLYCIHGSVLIGSLSSDLGTIQVCILITHH